MRCWPGMKPENLKRIKIAMLEKEVRPVELAQQIGEKLGRKITSQRMYDVCHGRLMDREIQQAITIMLDLSPSIWDSDGNKGS